MIRALLHSTRGRIVLLAILAMLLWQVWLSMASIWKVGDQFALDARRVDVLVTLRFPPERFHIQKFQEFGRVSGAAGTTVQVRGVPPDRLTQLARPFWVAKVEPIKQGDKP
ncbi:hypothetical protein [Castellaniella sp.]|uniref:hypothetical protein n=1 Tax=Castellaniella sp. TaxID=1955812 RepID=UPI003567AB4B